MRVSEDLGADTTKLLRWSSRLIAVLTVLVFLLNFVALTPPSPYVVLWWIALASWFVLGIGWLILVVQMRRFQLPRLKSVLWLFPGLLVLIVVLSLYRIPFKLAYHVNRGAMNEVAREVISGDRNAGDVHWIGIYPVRAGGGRHWHEFPFSVRGTDPIAITRCPYPSKSGFVFFTYNYSYIPNYGSTPKPDLEPIGDGWYAERSKCE